MDIIGNQKQQQQHQQQQFSASQSSNTATANTILEQLMGALSSLTLEVKSLKESMNTRLDVLEARSPSSSPPMTPQYSTPTNSSQESLNHTATSSPTEQPVPQEDKCWIAEEIGYFDGSGDVYTFTDRLTTVAANKSVKLIKTNLVTLLQDKALCWYHYEIEDHLKVAYNCSPSIDPWCQALIERFELSHHELMSQLEACQYTRRDAANKKDATVSIQNVMRITKRLKWPRQTCLMTVFHHFEPCLQLDLKPPGDLTAFIKQVQLRQHAWYQIHSTFGKQRPPDPRIPVQNHPSRPPQYPQQSSPPYRPPQPNSYRPSPQPSQQPQQQPGVYWADDEEEEWYYDPPSDSYYINTPAAHPPGHTPRRQGNTHDAGGNEAMANWASAGDDHRCSHPGCTHYH